VAVPAAYETAHQDKVDDILKALRLTKLTLITNNALTGLPPHSACVVVAEGHDATFVTFAGSDPAKPEDWITDFEAMPSPNDLHSGFAQAVETAGLWRDPDHEAVAPRRGKSRKSGPAPLVLIPGGEDDADFIYATGFGVETGLYIRYPSKEEVLAVSPLEVDRARAQSRVSNIVEEREAYLHKSWARLAASLLSERGITQARVSPAGAGRGVRHCCSNKPTSVPSGRCSSVHASTRTASALCSSNPRPVPSPITPRFSAAPWRL